MAEANGWGSKCLISTTALKTFDHLAGLPLAHIIENTNASLHQ